MFRIWLSEDKTPATLALLATGFTALLFLVPPEENLGTTIRLVYLHAALVQIGLLAFAAAAIAGAVALVHRGVAAETWSTSLQRTAVILWILYALSSLWVTHEAWGQWVAWDEPRTRASAKILGLCMVFLVLSLWVDRPRFTAFANVLMGFTTWVLVKTARLLRHPDNPIGTSDHAEFKLVFTLILVVALLSGIQFARWMRRRVAYSAARRAA